MTPSVVHIVVTDNFAGTERYVCDVANEQTRRGWRTAVVGGAPGAMRDALLADVEWHAGASLPAAFRSVRRAGRRTVCHAHMTAAELVALAARPVHRAPVVATRHFAAPRGKTRLGGLAAPHIAKRLARQIAVSDYVARSVERRPHAVIPNGVAHEPAVWSPHSTTVLVLQRLEAEKETLVALRAFSESGLAQDGWRLRVAGDGSERAALEAWAKANRLEAVEFTGWKSDVRLLYREAAILLAPAPGEPFGLVVVEAMMAGVPVVASAAGGHLETVGLAPGARMFPPGDHRAAGAALRSLTSADARAEVSQKQRATAIDRFTIARHVDELERQYDLA